MAYLPKDSVTISGGCHCHAIRYKISVPALEDRPKIERVPETEFLDTAEDGTKYKRKTPTTFPCILIDHCGICRHVAGTPLQFWCVVPSSWTEWTLESTLIEDNVTEHLAGVEVVKGTKSMKPKSLTLTSLEVCDSKPDAKNLIASTYVSKYSSSADVTRTFCSRCGTHISFMSSHYEINGEPVIDLTVGSFDDESLKRIHPERHMWWNSGIDWVKQLFRPDSRVCMKHPMGSPFDVIDGGETVPAI